MRRTSPSRDNVDGQEESGSAKAAQRSGYLPKPSQPMTGKRLAVQAVEQETMSDSPLFPRDLDHLRSLLGSPLPPLNSPPLFQPSPRRCTVTSPARPVIHRNHGGHSVGNGGLDSFFPAFARMPYNAFDTPTNRGMPMPSDLFTPTARKNNGCEQVATLLPDISRQHGQPQPQLQAQLPTAKDGDIPKAAPGSIETGIHTSILNLGQGMLPGDRQALEALRLNKQIALTTERGIGGPSCSTLVPSFATLSALNCRAPFSSGLSDSELGPGNLASLGCAAMHARSTGGLQLTIKDMLLANPDHDTLLPPPPPLVAQPLPLAPAACEAGGGRLRSRPMEFNLASRSCNLPGGGPSLDCSAPYAGYRGLIPTVNLPPPLLPALPLLPGLKSAVGQHGSLHLNGLEALSPPPRDSQQQTMFGATGSTTAAANIAVTNTSGPAAAAVSGEGTNNINAAGGMDSTPSTQLPFMNAGTGATATTGLYQGIPSTMLMHCGFNGIGALASDGLAPATAATTATATVDEADTARGSVHEQKYPSACKDTLHASATATAATTLTGPKTVHLQGEMVLGCVGGGRLAGVPLWGSGLGDWAAVDSPQSSLQTRLVESSQQLQQFHLQQHVLSQDNVSDGRAEHAGGGGPCGSPDGEAGALKDVAAVPEGLPPRGGGLGGGSGSGGGGGLGLHAGIGVGGGNASTPSTLQRPQRTKAVHALVPGSSSMAGSGGCGVTTPFESGGLGGGRCRGPSLELDVGGPDAVMSADTGPGGAARTSGSSGPVNRSRRPSDSGAKSCRCKMSQCLKLYCDCFAAERYCGACSCVACHNRPEYADRVQQRREDIAARNPQAFTRKIQHASNGNGKHKRGCNCRRSHCLKRYCECYQGGVKCGMQCTCLECENMGPASPPDPPSRGKRGGAAKAGRGGAVGSGGGARSRRASASTGSMMDDVPPSSPPPPSTSGYSDGPSPAPSYCTVPLSQQAPSLMTDVGLLQGSCSTPYPTHLNLQAQPPQMQQHHHQNQHLSIKQEEMYPSLMADGVAPGFHPGDGGMELQETLQIVPGGSAAAAMGAASTGMVLDGCSAEMEVAKGMVSLPEHLHMKRLSHSFQQPSCYGMQGLVLSQPQPYMVSSGDPGTFLQQQQHHHQQQHLYSGSPGDTGQQQAHDQQGQRVVRGQAVFPQPAQQPGLVAVAAETAYRPAGVTLKQEPMDGGSMTVDACDAQRRQGEQHQAQGSGGSGSVDKEGGCGPSQPSCQESGDAPSKRQRLDAEQPCGGGSGGALGDCKDAMGTSVQASVTAHLDNTASSHFKALQSLQGTLQHKQEHPSIAGASASMDAECRGPTGTAGGASASGSEGMGASPLLPRGSAPKAPASGSTEPTHVNSAGAAGAMPAGAAVGTECMTSLPAFTPRMLGISLDVVSPPPLSMLAQTTMLASDSEDCEEAGGCEEGGRTLGGVVGMGFVGGRAGQHPMGGMAGALRGGACVSGRGGFLAMRRIQQSPWQQHRAGAERQMHGLVDTTGLDDYATGAFADAMITAIAGEAAGRRGDGGRAEVEQGFGGSCGGDGTPGLAGALLCGELLAEGGVLLDDGGHDLHLSLSGPNSARGGGLSACFRGSSGMMLSPLPHPHLAFPQQHDSQLAGMQQEQLGARGRMMVGAGPAHLHQIQQRLVGAGAGGMMLAAEAGMGEHCGGAGDVLAPYVGSALTSCRGALSGAGDLADNMMAAAALGHPDGAEHYPWSQWLPLQRDQHVGGMGAGAGGAGCGDSGGGFLPYSSLSLQQSNAWLAPHGGSPPQSQGLGNGGGGGVRGFGVCRNGEMHASQLSLPLAVHGGSVIMHGPAGWAAAAAGVHTLVSPVRTSAIPCLLKRKACDGAGGPPDDEGAGGQVQTLDAENKSQALGEQQQRGGVERSVTHPSSSPIKNQQTASQGCTLQIAQLQLPPGTFDMYDTHPYPLPYHLQQQQQQQVLMLPRPTGGTAAPGAASAFLSPAPLQQQQQRVGSQALGGSGGRGPAPGGRGGRAGSAGRGGRGARQAVADKELLKASALQYITERLAKPMTQTEMDGASNTAAPSTGGALTLPQQGSLTVPHAPPQPQQQQLGRQSSGQILGDAAVGTGFPTAIADNSGGIVTGDRAPCPGANAAGGSVTTGQTHAVGAGAVVVGVCCADSHPVGVAGPASGPTADAAAAGSREVTASGLGPAAMNGGGVGSATCLTVFQIGGPLGAVPNTGAGPAPMRLFAMTKLGSGSMFFSPNTNAQLGRKGPLL